MGNSLVHYGVLGMHWGIRKDLPSFKSPKDLSSFMKGNIKYSEYTRLKSHSEVLKTKSGSCHDQVMFELVELRKMGLNPKAEFLIEYKLKDVGGQTHSFVYFNKDNKTFWFENAMATQEGVHEFNNLSEIKDKMISLHDSEKIRRT